jgi:hypothetical protein
MGAAALLSLKENRRITSLPPPPRVGNPCSLCENIFLFS